MDASNSTPHGLKSLLESLSRAALLAQPDDIPRFLCAHVENMIKFSDDQQLKDIIEVIIEKECPNGSPSCRDKLGSFLSSAQGTYVKLTVFQFITGT